MATISHLLTPALHLDRSQLPALAMLAAGVCAPRLAKAAAPEDQTLPVTEAQREIWLAAQFSANASVAYHESAALRLDGPLDVNALERALQQLVARHEALRTTFSADGETQRIAGRAATTLALHDFSNVPAADADAQAAAQADEEVHRPFELTRGPLFRCALLRLAARRHVLVLAVHHIVCDGWSLALLQRELAELYSAETAGRPSGLAAAPSFLDWARRKPAETESAAAEAAAKFWRGTFAEGAPVLELPTDRARTTDRTYAGGFLARKLPADVTAGLKRLCGQQECTLFTVFFAAFSVLLHRLSGQEEIVVGVPSAGQVMGGLGCLVGHFANLLPVRTRFADNPRFADYLAGVARNMTTSLEHWRQPFGAIIRELGVPRDASRVPLAPVVFNSIRHGAAPEFLGLQVEPATLPKRFVNFDLNVHFAGSGDELTIGCYYSRELYDEATIARWFGHFEQLLRAIAVNPNATVADLPLLSDGERQRLLLEWNNTALDYERDASIPQLFAEQVKAQPDAIALVAKDARWTYAELDRRANAIAARLLVAGVEPDSLVGIFLERSPDMVAAILGVLKAGGAYVPLDPALPKDRLAFIARDTGMKLVVTQCGLASFLPLGNWTPLLLDDPAARPPARVPVVAPPLSSDLAYVIYTSGSTGQPKGVCLSHRGVVALAAWARLNYKPEELANVLFATSVSFDVSVFESLVPLCLGGKITLVANILELPLAPHAADVTLISGVPSAVAELVRAGAVPPSVRTVNVAGEPCPQSLVEALHATGTVERVVDVYGPTETTVYSTGGVRRPGERATIGRPLPNEQAYILDRRMQPVPIGVPGELYLGGDKLARGYLNRPKLTRERFVDAPFLPGRRLYRTGDGARFLPDGRIEFLGRLDHQVKIRGYRIELGEIEAALAAQPGVREAVATTRPDAAGHARLLGYVVPVEGVTLATDELREQLRRKLPDYMVPAIVVALEKLPRTSTGKVDRKALPAPEFGAARATVVAPRSTTEKLLAEIWQEVLGLEAIGVHDNFFELGGHSLLAAQIIARLQDALGVEFTLRQFFAAPTVAGIAPVVESALLQHIGDAEASPAEQASPALTQE